MYQGHSLAVDDENVDLLVRSAPGIRLARGVARAMNGLGYACLAEVPLANGRRADLMAVSTSGDIVIVEIKSSVEDFRSDRKWPEYWEFCDALFFAVPVGFPEGLLPADCGLIRADPFAAEVVRESTVKRLAPARRKAVTVRFAHLAAARLGRLIDPGYRAIL
jgi:hypothetical protein